MKCLFSRSFSIAKASLLRSLLVWVVTLSNIHALALPWEFNSLLGISIFPNIANPFSPQNALGRDAEKISWVVKNFCDKVEVHYSRLGWKDSPCMSLPWTYTRVSERGYPIIYWEYGPRSTFTEVDPVETTLVLGGVHPDEITPIYFSFELARALYRDPDLYSGVRVVIAPLVNPDGFFRINKTRTNWNGVDLNRNLPTNDWNTKAVASWKKRRQSDPRHFPGAFPGSEEGTRFQVDLIEDYPPDKIISVHAPLGFLDYDGPGDEKKSQLFPHEKRAKQIANIIARKDYRVIDYGFYPGSLGNFAGNERHIPTVTLELKSTDPKLAPAFWRSFAPGIKSALKFEYRRKSIASLEKEDKKKTYYP